MYKLVIFDLDGTLLDTREGILKSVKDTLINFGLPMLNDEELHSFIGPPIQNSLSDHFKINSEKLQEAVNYFRDVYSSTNLFFAKPYQGIYNLCHYLSINNISMAVATYKREDYAIRLLNHFDFNNYFNVFFGADNFNILKKNDIIIKCMKHYKINNVKDVLMIGDTFHDAVGAAQIGLDFIAVTYGFGFKETDDFSKIYCIENFHSPKEIINYLKQQ